jgi:hypothetical protein
MSAAPETAATTSIIDQVPVVLRIETARVTVGETDGYQVESKIAYNGTRIDGERWQIATAEVDDHGPERRELVESISGAFEDAKELALRHATALYRLLMAKSQADEAFDALFASGSSNGSSSDGAA